MDDVRHDDNGTSFARVLRTPPHDNSSDQGNPVSPDLLPYETDQLCGLCSNRVKFLSWDKLVCFGKNDKMVHAISICPYTGIWLSLYGNLILCFLNCKYKQLVSRSIQQCYATPTQFA